MKFEPYEGLKIRVSLQEKKICKERNMLRLSLCGDDFSSVEARVLCLITNTDYNMKKSLSIQWQCSDTNCFTSKRLVEEMKNRRT